MLDDSTAHPQECPALPPLTQSMIARLGGASRTLGIAASTVMLLCCGALAGLVVSQETKEGVPATSGAQSANAPRQADPGSSLTQNSCAGVPAYAQRTDDVCANSERVVTIDGVKITVTSLVLDGSLLGADVTMVNTSSREMSYNILYWDMRFPNGDIKNGVDSLFDGGTFDSGYLAAGGSLTKSLRFKYAGPGLYVLTYEPIQIFAKRRAVWPQQIS